MSDSRQIAIEWADPVPSSEFSVPFVQGMADRMGVSYFKYGAVALGYPSRVDAIACLEKRLQLYKETGNAEWLMDVANFSMIEFMHPRHSAAHFRGTDSDESPGRVSVLGGENSDRNNVEVERLYARSGD